MSFTERQAERIAADMAAAKTVNAKMKTELGAGDYDDRGSYADYKAGVARDISETKATMKATPAILPGQIRCDCGHTVSRIMAMTTSTGTSCPDCYDRMSHQGVQN